MNRTLVAASLTSLALASLLGGWLFTGRHSVEAEANRLLQAPHAAAAREASALASELAQRLGGLVAAENNRPYYEYQNLYHDPRGASEGRSVLPSPLAHGPTDPLVALYFELLPDDHLRSPTLNDELPQLSDPARVEADRRSLMELRPALRLLRAVPASVPVVEPRPHAPPQAVAQVQQVQAFDPSSYAQNARPNEVFVQAQRHVATPAPETAETGSAGKNVLVLTGAFEWRTVAFGGEARLVAVRPVQLPDGVRTQGFVLSPDGLSAWFGQRDAALPAALAPGMPGDLHAALVPISGVSWSVRVDPVAALASATREATSLRLSFWLRFLPFAFLAVVCGALVVALFTRAEKLAVQRSQFAAAAAHELRTPLAGMSLYGDMLADGLGDPARQRDYAHRIADEARRLGRSVSNVLGFTRLERGVLACKAVPGDAAQAVRVTLDRMLPALSHAGLSVMTDIPDSVPARFDAELLAGILENLLDNAEKYSRGSEDRSVSLSVRPREGRVAIEVADRGPGVTQGLRRRLFQPFTRGSPGNGAAGLGIGLALARAQARTMAGDLTFESRTDGGSIFRLELPAS